MDPAVLRGKMQSLSDKLPVHRDEPAGIHLQDKEEIKKVGPHCRKCKSQVFPASMENVVSKKGTEYKKGKCPTCTTTVSQFSKKKKTTAAAPAPVPIPQPKKNK